MQNMDEKVAYLYDRSTNRNLINNEQISKILMDSDTEQTFTSINSLKLGEGYELAIKSIDINGDKAYLELSKNGMVVDNKVIQFSASNTNIGDQTYYYKADLGDTKEIVQIAVHFKNVFAGHEINTATVDGIFQLSETPTSLKADQHFDMMSISEVNPSTMTIKMDNKDNKITIRKNKDILLMGDIYIGVADQDNISAVNPLRYYIYKNVDNNWASKGRALKSQGKLDESLKAFDQAIALNPKESSYYIGRASALTGLGRQDEAVKAYDLAIQLKPDDPENWIAKGYVLKDQGKFNESLKAFDQAIAIKPNESSYYIARASALIGLGRQDEALKVYDLAIQLKPDDA